MIVVSGHQPNLLPGVSVLNKLAAADVFIAMDEMQFARHQYVNRNKWSDGTYFSVPVADADTYKPINRVRIGDPSRRFREKAARGIEMRLGAAGAPYAEHLRRPYQGLCALNVALLRQLCADLGVRAEWVFQSHLAAGRYDDVSEGIAAMVAEVGGDVWLSGPSGRNYLDERPFAERGIRVDYWEHDGANPTALELVRAGQFFAAA